MGRSEERRDRKRRRSRSPSDSRSRRHKDKESSRKHRSRRTDSVSRSRSKERSSKSHRDREKDREREREREKRGRSREPHRSESSKHNEAATESASKTVESGSPQQLKVQQEAVKKLSTEEEIQLAKERQREAENASLEEEMRKRRERVKAWQEAKAKQCKEADPTPVIISIEAPTNGTMDTLKSEVQSAVTETETTTPITNDMEEIETLPQRHEQQPQEEQNEAEADQEEEEEQDSNIVVEEDLPSPEPLRWTLEDDNEDEEEDDLVAADDVEVIVEPSLVGIEPSIRREDTETDDELKFALKVGMSTTNMNSVIGAATTVSSSSSSSSKPTGTTTKVSRWEIAPTTTMIVEETSPVTVPPMINENIMLYDDNADDEDEVDPLDAFMDDLYGSGQVANQKDLKNVHVNSIANNPANHKKSTTSTTAVVAPTVPPLFNPTLDDTSPENNELNYYGTNKTITLEEIMNGVKSTTNTTTLTPSTGRPGWESDIGDSPMINNQSQDDFLLTNDTNNNQLVAKSMSIDETEEEQEIREEQERKEFVLAIKKAREEEEMMRNKLLKLDEELMLKKQEKKKNNDDLGVIFHNEGDVLDEYEIEEKKRSAIELLEEAKKGKLLKEIDHSKITYLPFRKNLYIVPKTLSKYTEDDIVAKRDALQIKVRGKGCPPPVENWEQCGLSDRILKCIYAHQLKEPFAIQRQAIPAIMCGRDVIGVAKTGSGKTLAFLLPMFRHIQDQPPLQDNEGPIGLIMAPARELAFQIYNEAKKFTKSLGMRVACIYGGAGVAEQIADLKRGSEIVVCTPGRMIDILCMQAGKLVSLKRVTMVVMDEADRMFDMGFEPQIKMVIQNIRPDRQTIFFSATFPKQIEKLAKSVLKFPLEIIVGERSTVNKDITQYCEVHEEEDKFLRLLQLLGIWYEKGSILIFVDKQEKCDQLFQELLKLGYPCLSLHGGKDQVDRDHTLYEFKTGIKTVMIATSVAGRGLDVPDIVCVINFSCPNHLEDYVHRVGRTGRAGRKGTAYTFISSKEEQYAPSMLKALQKTGQIIPEEVTLLAKQFKEKVDRGEAQYSGSGFVGKGYTFDASEMNETQKAAMMQKNAYAMEQGLILDKEGRGGDEFDFDYDEEDQQQQQQQQVQDVSNTPGGSSLSNATTPSSSTSANAMAMNEGGPAIAIDAKAALARAKLIAMQLASKRPTGGDPNQPEFFMDELDINDYPLQARRKVTNRNVLDEITERTNVAIISRGSYIPPTKKLEPGERRLHLLIEGSTEMTVRQAKLEIQRALEEETMKIGASVSSGGGGGGGGGRYSVVG